MQLIKVKQFSTLFGSALLHFMIGSGNTFSNLNTYMTSYLRQNGNKDANYGQSVWFTAVGVLIFTLMTIMSGFVVKRIGTRITCIIGSLIISGSIALTSIALKHSFLTVLFTFGFLQSMGSGLMYTVIIVNCIKWFPRNKGLVSGIITGSNAFSSFFFTQIQTFYLNPNNIPPNSDGYFVDENMLRKVPKMFIILGIIYGSIGLFSICLIFNAKNSNEENNQNVNTSQTNLIIDETNECIAVVKPPKINYTFRQVYRSRTFYILWISFGLCTQTSYIIGSLIKAFGQTFIGDDHYLAIVLSFCFIVNGIGGVFWGKILDYLKFKDTICLINGILAILAFSFITSSYVYQKILYAFWCFAIYFSGVGIFSCFLPEVVMKFGDLNATVIYGLIHIGPATITLIFSPIIEVLLNSYGWFTTFCSCGALNVFSMVVIMIMYKNHNK